MNHALSIVRHDLRTLRGNVFTAVVVFGVVIIPLLFSCFNVLASWDPFGNTSRLKIAVASNDRGYEGDITSLRINLGDEVIGQLSRNEDIDWVPTSSAEAVEGTRAGTYYAAIVLPESFSEDLFTFYVAGAAPSQVELFTNEKVNALSTSVTQRSAGEVVEEIDESFNRVVANVGLGAADSLNRSLASGEAGQAAELLQSRMESLAQRAHGAAGTARSVAASLDSAIPLAESAAKLSTTASELHSTAPQDSFDSNSDLVGGSLSGMDAAFNEALRSYEQLGLQLDATLNDAAATRSAAAQNYRDAAVGVGAQATALENVAASLQNTSAAGAPLPSQPLEAVSQAAGQARALERSLQAAAEDAEGSGDAGNGASQSVGDRRGSVNAALGSARDSLARARDGYSADIRPQLEELEATIGRVAADVGEVRSNLSAVGALNDDDPQSAAISLARARDNANDLARRLEERGQSLSATAQSIESARLDGDLSRLAELVQGDPAGVAARLSAPVAVDREAIFPVASFGAAVAPFYMALSLWIGALLACTLLRAGRTQSHGELKIPVRAARTQEYLGRFATFGLIALAQSTLVVAGMVGFVEIHPAHPFLLLASAWLTSLVFMLIVYTLVLTLDNAGKALTVLLLVMQVSGSGGIYPLGLLPDWFAGASPFLPATYAIGAFRAAIAGIDGAELARNLGFLSLFLIPALVVGLWFRRYLDGYHRRLRSAIDSTGVLA